MTLLQKNIIIAAILTAMLLLASYPAFAKAEPTPLQANPMYRIKAAGIDPNAIGPDNPYYTPADIKNAYKLPSSGGSGTIAIVDAYSDPNIASNLASFSTQWGLAVPNLEIYKMSSFIQSNSGWGMEESLDVEWAHAIAPNAKILLVEATSASTTDLLSAVNYAAGRSDVVAISMSWGANEFSGEQSYDSYFTSKYAVSFFASSGDTGGVVTWPSSSANVISVGGTTLTQTQTGYTESAWSSGGGGVSAYEQVPAGQASLGYKYRATPDVAYNADPNTGFLVLDTYGYGGWYAVGGTSAGAPQWAAIESLGLSVTSQNLYNDFAQPSTYAADFTDITTGSNGHPAGTGYDLATGLGSPLTINFAAPATPDFSLSASTSTLTIPAGQTGTLSITAASLNGYSGTVSLSVTDPNGYTPTSLPSITVPPTQSDTLAISVPLGATPGTYTVTVTGTSGSLMHSISITYTVTIPDFSLSSTPSSMTIPVGQIGTATVKATSLNQYQGTVNLAVSDLNGWLSLTPTQIIVPLSGFGTASLSINVPSGTSLTTDTITVVGTDASGAPSHTITIPVTVTNPDFSISASPTSLNIRSGSQNTSKVTITALNGFAGTVSLAATASGGGLTVTFSPSSITKSGSSTLTIKVPSTTRSGTFTVTVTGTSGTLIHTTKVTVTVSRF